MLPAEEVHVLDANAAFFGVPTSTLMENAGKGVADYVTHLTTQPEHILLFCGPGNNGGDGFVAARYLSKTYKVTVVPTAQKQKTLLSQENRSRLSKTKIQLIHQIDEDQIKNLLHTCDLVIDAMLGIGIKGDLREPYKGIVQHISNSQKPVLAVDVPTGLDTALSIQPQYTVTFHDAKQGMTKHNCGTIHVVDIGIPKEAMMYVGPGELQTYYPRSLPLSHKGDNGIVSIIGGGPYTGAPALCGLAALRTGADLVYIATPQSVSKVVASFSPNLIVTPFPHDHLTPDDIPHLIPIIEKSHAIALGPGLGKEKETIEALQELIGLIAKNNKALLLDADAIQYYTLYNKAIAKTPTVITPHAGEFTTLTKQSLPSSVPKQVPLVQKWAQQLGVTLLLKGPEDIISDGTMVKQNKIHTPAMTVGGTGDVLAGVVTALLSKQVAPFHAARIGAFLNGAAGKAVFEEKSYGLVASDIIETIPAILKQYL